MRTLQALFVALIVLFAVCAAAPAYPEMEDVLVGMRPVFPPSRYVKRWARMEPSIRFAGGSNAAWFV